MIKKRRVIVISSDEESEGDDKSNSKRVCMAKTAEESPKDTPTTQSNPLKSSITPIHDPVSAIASLIKSGARPSDFLDISSARESLHRLCLNIVRKENFSTICSQMIEKVFKIIDQYIFMGCIRHIMKQERRVVTFRVSSRMTSRAGQLSTDSRHPQQHELSISSHLLFQAFSSPDSRPITVNGVQCSSRLECLLRIIEHEMVHLLLFCTSVCRALLGKKALGKRDEELAGGDLCGEGFHGKTFQQAARRICGHSAWQHDLITTHEIAYIEHGICVGANVKFTVPGEGELQGKVNRVQKRVTVLVKEKDSSRPHVDAREFSDGNYYRKYYVPIDKCQVVAAVRSSA